MEQQELAAEQRALGLSNDQFAKALGIGRTTLWRYQHGHVAIPLKVTLALSWLKVRPK